MATDLGELTPALDQETGVELTELQLIALLQAAVETFNAAVATQVVLTGTTLDRTLDGTERRLLILFGLATHLRGEVIKNAKVAIVHSNIAGRTELNNIPRELRRMFEDALKEIKDIVGDLESTDIASDVTGGELGETLHITGMPYQTSAWWQWPY